MERIIALLLTACLMSCGAQQPDQHDAPRYRDQPTPERSRPFVTSARQWPHPHRVLGEVEVRVAGPVLRSGGSFSGGGDPGLVLFLAPILPFVVAKGVLELGKGVIDLTPWAETEGNTRCDGLTIAFTSPDDTNQPPPPDPDLELPGQPPDWRLGKALIADVARDKWAETDAVTQFSCWFESPPHIYLVPKPRPVSGADLALVSLPSQRVKIESFEDDRAQLRPSPRQNANRRDYWQQQWQQQASPAMIIGQYEPPWFKADIYVPRGVRKLIRDTVAAQWQAAGHVVVEQGQDLTITGRITEFKASTSIGEIRSTAAGEVASVVDVIVEIQGGTIGSETLTRQYRSEHEAQWFSDPTEPLETTVNACLEDLMRQIASDTEVIRLLSDRPTGAATASLSPCSSKTATLPSRGNCRCDAVSTRWGSQYE